LVTVASLLSTQRYAL